MNPGDQSAADDRTDALLGYLMPVIGALYLITLRRKNPTLWRHGIQGLILYVLLIAVFNLLEMFLPLEEMAWATAAMFIGFAGMVACAVLAYRGHALRMPWIADLAEKWQPAVGGLVDHGFAAMKQREGLALHRLNLKSFTAVKPKDVLPTVEGKPGMDGFQVEFAGALDKLAVRLLGERMKPYFTRSEILVEKWPLRMGDESGVRFHAWPRRGGSVERIVAQLSCLETVRYRHGHGRPRSDSLRVQWIAVGDASAGTGADGSTGANWILTVPREGPPSFKADGGGISWLLQVEMQFAGGRSARQSFDLVVLPQLAAT